MYSVLNENLLFTILTTTVTCTADVVELHCFSTRTRLELPSAPIETKHRGKVATSTLASVTVVAVQPASTSH